VIATVKTDPFAFRARVSDAGYEWLKGEDDKLRLVPRRVPGTGFHESDIGPGLFLQFKSLSETRAEIESFASVHGDLFNRYEPSQRIIHKDGTASYGLSLKTWTQEINDMKTVAGLWECIKGRNLAILQKVILWTDKEVGYVLRTSPKRRVRRVTLAHADIPNSGFLRFSKEDVLLPARCALQEEINARLADSPPVPRLVWTPDYHERVVLSPPNLLSAMWLQFAQAVTSEFELYPCDACGQYFQRGPGGRRADSATCSDACRQRKNRKAKAAQ
jgi:hypothetical protein